MEGRPFGDHACNVAVKIAWRQRVGRILIGSVCGAKTAYPTLQFVRPSKGFLFIGLGCGVGVVAHAGALSLINHQGIVITDQEKSFLCVNTILP